MRLAYKISLAFFALGYGTALLENNAAWILSSLCFTASFCIGSLSFLNGDAK